MQCPHCKFVEKDEATECSRCGLVFAKWKAPSSSFSGSIISSEPQSGWSLGVWILLLSATVGVWFLNRAGKENPSDEGAAQISGSAAPAESKPIPKNSWRFEGRIFDLLRGGPIKGVKVSFVDLENGQYYEDTTDDDGHYSVDVEIRWKQGYALELTHPLYRQRYWPGTAMNLERKDRLRMGMDEDPSIQSDVRYRGSKKKAAEPMDFALFPRDLSDAEREELGQAPN